MSCIHRTHIRFTHTISLSYENVPWKGGDGTRKNLLIAKQPGKRGEKPNSFESPAVWDLEREKRKQYLSALRCRFVPLFSNQSLCLKKFGVIDIIVYGEAMEENDLPNALEKKKKKFGVKTKSVDLQQFYKIDPN